MKTFTNDTYIQNIGRLRTSFLGGDDADERTNEKMQLFEKSMCCKKNEYECARDGS